VTPIRPAQPLKLFSSPLSARTHRVGSVLSILDLLREVIDVDLAAGATEDPPHVALLGERKAPGDGVLVQSKAADGYGWIWL
jgi:glutathione S-transferase